MKKINDKGYNDINNIFLLFGDNNGNITIYDKNYEIKNSILE